MPSGIILARGGSKVLPRKNLLKVCRETLIARCVHTCVGANQGPVYVSTDDDEIAAEAERAGASVIHRPPELAGDNATSWDALRHAASRIDGEVLFWAQCTAPLMTAGDVRNCVEALSRGEFAACVHECHDFQLDANGCPLFDRVVRRQDMERRYVLSGSAWAFTRRYLMQCETYSGPVVPVLSENPVRCDIDSAADLWLARMVADPRPCWTNTLGME